MRAGLIAGSVAAVAAALVSLPLRSPNDLLFNSATVSVAAIALGIVAGAAWSRLADTTRPALYFSLLLAAALILFALASLLLDAFLERSFTFSVPPAATAVALVGVIVPLLDRRAVAPNRWVALAVLGIARRQASVSRARGTGRAGILPCHSHHRRRLRRPPPSRLCSCRRRRLPRQPPRPTIPSTSWEKAPRRLSPSVRSSCGSPLPSMP